MANTFGIPLSQRRPYRAMASGSTPSLPPVSSKRTNYKRSSKTSGIIDAVSKEKWTFLQRLLAIEDKHEQKRLARQKESSSKKDNDCGFEKESNPAANGRWISDQILDDDEEPSYFHEEPISHPVDTPLRDHKSAEKSLYTSSLPSINRTFPMAHDSESKSLQAVESPLQSPLQMQQREESFMSRIKRKRPLRLPPILLPPLYTMRPRPLQEREFLKPTRIRGPITDDEWEDLYNCRYIRHVIPKHYAVQLSSSQSSFCI